MADDSFQTLFDSDTAPDVKRPHTPPADLVMAIALTYEQAVLDCLAALEDRTNLRAQAEACVRYEAAMAEYMALPKASYARTTRALDKRGLITGSEWQRIRDRMSVLSRMPADRFNCGGR